MDQMTLQEQNKRLAGMLREARDQMIMLKLEVDRLSRPPAGFGLTLTDQAAGPGELELWADGRKMRINASPPVGESWPGLGHEVVLNEAFNVVGIGDICGTGEVVTLLDVLADGRRGIVATRGGEERVMLLAAPVRRARPYPGDRLLIYPHSDVAVEVVPASAWDAYMTEGRPNAGYADLAGLTEPAAKLAACARVMRQDPGELAQAGITPQRGVLLYGPEGCGKATLARAFANSLGADAVLVEVSYPNLLDKYVGEIERRIGLIFRRAREMARRGFPVVVFFPRIDLFHDVLGADRADHGISLGLPLVAAEISDIQQLSERVVVVGTSRRRSVDSVLLRPGRLEVQVEVPRPNQRDAREILTRCLTEGPGSSAVQPGGTAYQADHGAVEQVLGLIYEGSSAAGQIEVSLEDGQRRFLSFPDLISRALLRDIANRAKTGALMRALNGREMSVRAPDLMEAARAVMEQTMQLAGTSRRYDWCWLHELTGLAVTSARRLPAATA